MALQRLTMAAKRAATLRVFMAAACGLAVCSAFAGTAAGAQGGSMEGAAGSFVYLALGDSTGVGYGARKNGGYVDRLATRMRRQQAEVRLQNLCVNGATSADVLRSQVPAAKGVRPPALITLQVGVNDLSRQVAVPTFARTYESILKTLSATGAAVIVANLPDVSLAPVVPPFLRPEVAVRVKAYNEQIAAAAKRAGATLVDIYGPSQELIPQHPEWFSSDGFHPSDEGYEFWAEQMWPAVTRALPR